MWNIYMVLINAMDHGVPQYRLRSYAWCIRKDWAFLGSVDDFIEQTFVQLNIKASSFFIATGAEKQDE
eukprot:7425489-Lingulodinium_polyedra.AAC.1